MLPPTQVQDALDDAISDLLTDCDIESEGYPHGFYITGESPDSIIQFLRDMMKHTDSISELVVSLEHEPTTLHFEL